MCKEVLQIVQRMDVKSVELQLALHCAPVITGIKISNLIFIAREDEDALRLILRKSGISYFRLLQTGEKTAFLLFHRGALEAYLAQPQPHRILAELGYEDFSFGCILRNFQNRYQTCIGQGQQFPHEIGLLLGYPVEDVVGFMEHGGKDYLYSGYWKVYENVNEKKRLFARYEEAKETLIRLLNEDIDIRVIMQIYRDDNTTLIA